jgi:hypothetical protein
MKHLPTTTPAPLAAGAVHQTQASIGEHNAMSENSKTTIAFRKLRDTKNTVRFEEEVPPGKPPVIGTIYVQRWFAGDADKLAITIDKEGK